MKQIFKIFIFLLIVGLTSSCQKDFLQLDPLSDYSDAAVWNDPALIETFVNNIYRNALGFPFAIERLSDYVDESHFTPDWDVTNFNKCLMTSDGLMGWDVDWGDNSPSKHTRHYRWGPLYSNVRACNIFFEKTAGADYGINQSLVDDMAGEVHFLRAYTYHYLAALYGGVPIITEPYGLSDDFEVARNTYEETVNYIVQDLDAAAAILPDVQEGDRAGRATRGAAMHLKARTLLYAASDLHHSMQTYAPGFSNPELLGYTSGSQNARWEAAKDAAKAVMNLGIYDLVSPDPAPGDDIAQTFIDYFISYGYEEEDILLQYFTPKTDENWDGYNPALYCGPNGYHNWGNNVPLGELVDDYEFADGTKFDWSNPAHAAAPYTNREARFYATILYEGADWRVRPSDVQEIDPWNKIQVGHVYNLAGDLIVPGVDTRSGPIEDWNGGKSGYYVKKFVDKSVDPQYVKQDIPFRHFRYAETLLNYAEACIELEEDDEAKTYLNMIRKRAGLPDITSTGDDLRQDYRHERRIEMAYEDQRFWDVRRWVIGPEAYHQTHRVDVRYETDQPATNYRQADGSTWGDPIFSEAELGGDARAWLDKAYFFPIYRDEMNKNSLLIQNPGY
ncbi:MAG: RagB/SusD family nutrient uptake outer membrane protein [Bacteroidales bacterium]|nr:RagB/SusD family nutrient uptake outer membrane protein [Bacteroidales bacterium]